MVERESEYYISRAEQETEEVLARLFRQPGTNSAAVVCRLPENGSVYAALAKHWQRWAFARVLKL